MKKVLLLILFGSLFLIENVNALEIGNLGGIALGAVNFCTKLKSPLKFIGYIVFIVKIIVPILLLIFGIIDLFKAVTGGKDGEIMKSVKSFAFRVIAGVLIFFVPTIISFVFSLVDGFDEVTSDYNVCQTCILNVSQCDDAEEQAQNAN